MKVKPSGRRQAQSLRRPAPFRPVAAILVMGGLVTGGWWWLHQVSAAGNPPAIGAALAPAGYQLAWGDEFNGASVDNSKWAVLDNSNDGYWNNEDQCYEAGNATAGGGFLAISAKRQTVTCNGTNPDKGNTTYYWTSAFLQSKSEFKEGYIEVSAKLPKGNPWWPAMWLAGGAGTPNWPDYGEIDVMEGVGIYPDTSFGTYYWGCGGGYCASNPRTYNLADGSGTIGAEQNASNYASFNGVSTSQYVRFGTLWESDRVTWYINGRATRSLDSSGVVRRYDASGNPTVETAYTGTDLPGIAQGLGYNHVINLDLAVGGQGPSNYGYTGNDGRYGYNNGNLAADVPGVMSVDYVHVYVKGTATPIPVVGTPITQPAAKPVVKPPTVINVATPKPAAVAVAVAATPTPVVVATKATPVASFHAFTGTTPTPRPMVNGLGAKTGSAVKSGKASSPAYYLWYRMVTGWLGAHQVVVLGVGAAVVLAGVGLVLWLRQRSGPQVHGLNI